MQYIITAPAALNCDVKLPASKSISNRALIISALAGGHQLPDNLSDCDDTEVIVRALRDNPETIDIKAAGTAMRFMTAYLAVTEGEHVITGTERMKHRPIAVLVDALRFIGAKITYEGEEGYPPLRIKGRQLRGGELHIKGNVSSQYISALLMIGPTLKGGLELHLEGDIISRPYIDLTLWMMKEYGADAEWSDINVITVKPKPYTERRYYIENDWSAASYWYEMMALNANTDDEVILEGLLDGSKQGDSIARYLFSLLGVKTSFLEAEAGKPASVRLKYSGRSVARLEYDFLNCPDLTQTFVVTCVAKNIPFHFTGLQTLKIKETDRIEALKTEMRKLGYVLEDRNDSELIWDGTICERADNDKLNIAVDTYEDHRMALAFAPVSLVRNYIRINDPHVVTKSYPHYWEDLDSVGFEIIEE
ncbi:MAG: 3-phosphoshikimate 1-carboxyvinyltransferase [Prevotella sp.]